MSDITEFPRLLPLTEIMKITGLRKSTIYKWIGEGNFPRALKLGTTCVRWRADEIEDWVNSLHRS